MASKKGISYQWRFFVPTAIALWVIIFGMAFWQVYRVSNTKLEMIYDQLELVGNYISETYADGRNPQPFLKFVNQYYYESRHYDEMTIQISDNQTGVLDSEIGLNLPNDIILPDSDLGIVDVPILNISTLRPIQKYLYYQTLTDDGLKTIKVFLPYSKTVSQLVSASTTRFWLIFIGIAIIATIFAYISSLIVSRNVRILTNFAQQAATNPHFRSDTSSIEFPNDELGEACRQIMVIYNQRIEEMERSEREHRVAMNAIKEKERIKRELTANINHELKTPVGIIQGYIDTMVDNPDMDVEDRDRFLLKVQDNVHRLTALINDVTTVTRLGAGGKLVNVEEVDYHDLVFTLAYDIQEQNLTGKMSFKYDIPLNCKVMGNAGLLGAMIHNLIKNAVAYSQGTEIKLQCTGEDDKFYYFSFYDNGMGVPPEHLPHLFERFYRVNSGRSRETGGTGLGLSIVQVTVQTFGGEIEVLNRHPQGLEFKYSLPKSQKQ